MIEKQTFDEYQGKRQSNRYFFSKHRGNG